MHVEYISALCALPSLDIDGTGVAAAQTEATRRSVPINTRIVEYVSADVVEENTAFLRADQQRGTEGTETVLIAAMTIVRSAFSLAEEA